MIAARVFTVLAAAFLVGAVALGSLMPVGTSLEQGLVMADRGAVDWIRASSARWLWDWIEAPFLVRPLWMVPAALGIVCAGAAASVNLGRASPSRRKRS